MASVTEDIKKETEKAENPKANLAQEIMRRFQSLEFLKEPWIPMLQEIADLLLPTRHDIRQTDQRGKRQDKEIYDGTAQQSVQLHVDALQGSMVSESSQWFRLKIEDAVLNEDAEVVAWLQDTEKRLMSAFGRSNFYEAIRPMLEDGVTLGTGYIFPEPDQTTGRVQFASIHPGECWIADNKYGRVDTLFRKWQTTARQVVQRFGEDKVSATLKEAYKKDPYTSVTLMHACYPREDRMQGKQDSQNMPWASVWIEIVSASTEGQNTRGHILNESGFRQFPYIVWRYRKTGKEVYGRCPAMDALGEIQTLNSMSRSVTARAQLEAEPMMNISADDKATIQYRPRGRNYYADPNKKPEVMGLGNGYSIGIEHLTRKEEMIEKHFRTDYFLSISASEREITAYEASLREGEKAMITGSISGRLTSEVFTPLISRMFTLESEAGNILAPPAKLIAWAEESGNPLDVEYTGPMQQAQRRHFATGGIDRGLEKITPYAAIKEEILDKINFDEVTDIILRASGFPQTAIYSDEIVAQVRQARKQLEQAQLQAEQMLNMTEGVKNVADADAATDGQVVSQLSEG